MLIQVVYGRKSEVARLRSGETCVLCRRAQKQRTPLFQMSSVEVNGDTSPVEFAPNVHKVRLTNCPVDMNGSADDKETGKEHLDWFIIKDPKYWPLRWSRTWVYRS